MTTHEKAFPSKYPKTDDTASPQDVEIKSPERVTTADIIRAREDLVDLGFLEDSGERRPDPQGTPQIVWRMTPLGVTQREARGIPPDDRASVSPRWSSGTVRSARGGRMDRLWEPTRPIA